MTALLASDDQNTAFAGARNPDDVLFVQFYSKAVQDNFKSEKEGHPIFYDAMYVRIMTPGNNLNIIDTEVREEHKRRFPRQWMQFTNSTAPQKISGTPLEEWPLLTRSRAEELRAQKFFTVEQVAGCSDQQLQAVGMDGHAMREKAKAYLEQAKGSAVAQAQAAELVKRDEKLKAMSAEMEELRALILAASVKTEKPKRAYKRKVQPSGE